MFKEMDNIVRGQRVKGLTNETANALHVTFVGIVNLTKLLLSCFFCGFFYAYFVQGR